MMTGIIGLPRQGKSTLLAKIAKKRLKKGIKCYSNFPMKGCLKLNFNDLGKKNFHDCCILIDEISLFADCRNFKDFGDNLVYFFTNYGHFNVEIFYCTQNYDDCDKKIRCLTDELYSITSFWRFSLCRPIVKSIIIDGDIKNCYVEKRIPKIIYRPFYYDMFDSYNRRELPEVDDRLWFDVGNSPSSLSDK